MTDDYGDETDRGERAREDADRIAGHRAHGTHEGDATHDEGSAYGRDGAGREPSFVIREDEDEDEKRKPFRWLTELVVIVLIVLGLMFLVAQFGFRQYVVPSESMEPTLHGCDGCANDRIAVDKMVYRFSDPEPGDVVVFKAPSDSWDGMWQSPRSSNEVIHKVQDVLSWFALQPPDENNLVKRVIATGGQTVECHADDGRGVVVDGKPLDEPYIDLSLQAKAYSESGGVLGGGSCFGQDFGPITVPDGNVWVMGDNRSDSADSRAHTEDRFHGTVPVSDIRGKVRFIIYPFSRIGGVGSVDPQH